MSNIALTPSQMLTILNRLRALNERIHFVQSEDEDIIRRGRGLITICTAFAAILSFATLITPFAAPPERQAPSYFLFALLITFNIISGLLAKRGKVDEGGLFISAAISTSLAGYIFTVQTYTPGLWLISATVVIASIAVRPALIWAAMAFNMGLLTLLYVNVPADPTDPTEKLRITALLCVLHMMLAVVTYVSASRTRALFLSQLHAMLELRSTRDQLSSTLIEANSARAAAEAASRSKSTFLANMSHELRTPLNAIIGYAELIQEESDAADSSEDLDKIRGAGRHLLTLIDDILDLSRIEAGKMSVHPETVEVGALLDGIAQTLSTLLSRNDNTLITRTNAGCDQLYTDRTRLHQILLNLATNAAKFTNHGTITLSASRTADHIIFTLEDTGIGMDADTLERVFGEFVQADASTTRKYGGTGLGLPLSQKLAALLGGQISAASTPGQGSTFTLTLPHRLHAEIEAHG
jgi:signal transduction histidine kinase